MLWLNSFQLNPIPPVLTTFVALVLWGAVLPNRRHYKVNKWYVIYLWVFVTNYGKASCALSSSSRRNRRLKVQRWSKFISFWNVLPQRWHCGWERHWNARKYFYFCTVEIITFQPAMPVLWQTKFPLLSRNNNSSYRATSFVAHKNYFYMLSSDIQKQLPFSWQRGV